MIKIIKKHFKKIIIAILGLFTLTAAAATVLMVPQGGTGINSVTGGSYLKGAGTGALVERNAGEVKTDLSLNLVENTALSTWAGSGNITTLGTIIGPFHMQGDGATASTGYGKFGFSASEYTEIGHRGANSSINAVGDGRLDFRHDGATKAHLTDAGIFTATTLVGALTGNVTGNCSGSSGSCTGNSATATALSANGANCSAGQYPLGVDSSGAVESCTNVNTVWLTNKSGGSLAANDTVVIDTGTNNAVTTTTASANKRVIGVIKTGGAADAQVEVQIDGIVSVKIAAVVPGPGYFLRTATSAKYVYASGTSGAAGDFLISLQGGGPGATITAMFKKAELN